LAVSSSIEAPSPLLPYTAALEANTTRLTPALRMASQTFKVPTKLLWWVLTGSSTDACTDATAARCTTAVTPMAARATHSASATSPSSSSTRGLSSGRLLRLPVDRLSSTRTE